MRNLLAAALLACCCGAAGAFSHFLIVLRDRLVRLAISLIDLPSRSRSARILPFKAMVITFKSPATKSSRVGLSPWSVLNRHYTALLVSFRSASTPLKLSR